MHRRLRYPIAAALVSCPLLALGAPAGTLDPTFAVGGKQTILPADDTEFYTTRALTVRDSAGRIYAVAGQADPEDFDLAHLVVTRLHHDGAVDTSYGNAGTVSLPGSGFKFFWPSAAAMQPDGRIVVGFGQSSNTGIKICRLLQDGSLDGSFGLPATPGCTDAGPDESSVEAILLPLGGRIVIAGRVGFGDANGFVAKFNSDGSLNQTFGDEGIVLVGPTNRPQFFAAALAPNGDIVAAGNIKLASNKDFLVAKFDGTIGTPVTDFGTGGFAVIPFDLGGTKTDTATSVAVLGDGSIVAAGNAYDYNAGQSRPRPAVVRMTSSGNADGAFGPGGKRTYNPCVDIEITCGVLVTGALALPDKRFVLSGWMTSPFGSSDFFAMRVLANGTADPDFGTDPSVPGRAVVAFDVFPDTPSLDEGHGIALDGQRILLTGWAIRSPSTPDRRKDIALARLDHGLTAKFLVTPKAGAGGAVSPATAQMVGHSDRAEFVVIPDPGFALKEIVQGPGRCKGGMDGEVFVSAPVEQACEVHLTFEQTRVFVDGFE